MHDELTHNVSEDIYRSAVCYRDSRAFDINRLVALT